MIAPTYGMPKPVEVPPRGAGCDHCFPCDPCRPCNYCTHAATELRYPAPCSHDRATCAAVFFADQHDADQADADDRTAEAEAIRQASVDELGGAVPPYDVTDDFEGQRVGLAAYLQWAADRYAGGLAMCDHQPACWRCAHYPCETYATELPCPGGYVPVRMQTEEFDLGLRELGRQRRAQMLAEVGEEATTKVMTPLNPRWDAFATGLAMEIRAEGCDAVSLRLSERILGAMDGIDVGRSLDFFRAHGGFCDCEVLRNVDV